MAKKTTIYIPDKIMDYIARYGENSLSGAITTLIERYSKLTAEATPQLTLGEWCAICDANNGCGIWLSAGGPDQGGQVWMNVAEGEKDGLNEKWGIDCADLGRRIMLMPLDSRLAVWDVAARFWNTEVAEGEGYESMLSRCGARVKKETLNRVDKEKEGSGEVKADNEI